MRFLFPSLFYLWAPLVLVPIVLYLFRPRPRTVKTTTLPFFKWLAKEHQDSAWLRILKYLISLLLTVMVVLGGAAAMGRLVVTPAAEDIKTVVILVDRSASMGTVDSDQRSRLDVALDALGQRVAGLTASVGVVVIAYDRRPEVVLARSVDRRQVERALASIQHRPVSGDPAAAMLLAERLAAIETPAAIWHATDQPKLVATDDEPGAGGETATVAAVADQTADTPSADGPQLAPGHDENPTVDDDNDALDDDVLVQHFNFSAPQPINVGITALQMRRLPLERGTLEVFVQIGCSAPQEVQATLDVYLDGREVDLRTFTIQPGATETLLVEIKSDATTDRIAKLQVSTKGDQLTADDSAYLRVPKLRPIKVLWIRPEPDPFTKLALSTLAVDGDVEVFEGNTDAWPPKEAVDVAIFDDWLPEQWPESGSIVVINPPSSVGPIRAVRLESDPLPIADLRATNPGHPLLYGVATAHIQISQTAVLEADGPLQSLWVGAQGPVLLAGQSQGQRIVVVGFSPQLSDQLPFMASYPLLIGNAIYWGAEQQLEQARGMNRRTGELVELDGKQMTWVNPAAPDQSLLDVPLDGRSIELDRIGLWKTDAGVTGSAALLAPKETRLSAADAQDGAAEAATLADIPLFGGDLAPLLLIGLLCILLAESWLYHRCIIS